MRRKLTILFLSIVVFGLCGCLVNEIPLTNNEQNIIAEYAAESLLKYNSRYDRVLLTRKDLTPTPEVVVVTPVPTDTPTPTPTPTPTKAADSGRTENVTPTEPPEPTLSPTPTLTPTPTGYPENTIETWQKLNNVLGQTNVYSEMYSVEGPVKEYLLGDGTYALNRQDGKEYYIVQFKLTNISSQNIMLDIFSQDLICALVLNGKTTVKATTTLFPNDLRFLGVSKDEIKASKSQYAILVFTVDAGIEIDKAAVFITNKANETVLIKIK